MPNTLERHSPVAACPECCEEFDISVDIESRGLSLYDLQPIRGTIKCPNCGDTLQYKAELIKMFCVWSGKP